MVAIWTDQMHPTKKLEKRRVRTQKNSSPERSAAGAKSKGRAREARRFDFVAQRAATLNGNRNGTLSQRRLLLPFALRSGRMWRVASDEGAVRAEMRGRVFCVRPSPQPPSVHHLPSGEGRSCQCRWAITRVHRYRPSHTTPTGENRRQQETSAVSAHLAAIQKELVENAQMHSAQQPANCGHRDAERDLLRGRR